MAKNKKNKSQQDVKIDKGFKPLDTQSTDNNKAIDKLLGMFRLARVNDNKNLVPAKPELNKKGEPTGSYKPIEMPTSIEQAYQYFVQNLNTGIYQSNAYRLERYKDCKYMVTVEPIMNTACQIYVSETYSVESGEKPIIIKAKDKKLEKLFYTWLDNVGFTDNFVRDCIYNLVVFGDAFWVNEIDINAKTGVTGVTCLDPFLVANRMEFNVGMTNQQQSWYNTSLNMSNTYGSLKQVLDIVNGNNLEDFSQFYKSYLFGYELKLNAETTEARDVRGVPPWAITHCRMFSTETDFFPFGKPIFLNALASFKSYKTTQMLVDMLRVATFPKEVIKIKGSENMDIYTRMQRVDETRQFLENITPRTNNQDGLSVGDRLYTMEDLFEWDIIDTDIDMDKLGDLEMKESSMVMATGIPDSYLMPSKGAGDLGGENAESLYYLNKIFQRRCDSIRSAFLEGLTETFRMHLLLTGNSDGDKSEFELSMPTNTEQFNDDKVSHDSDMLDLATNIISNLGQAVGLERGETINPIVVKDILKMYMPIEPSKLDKWVDLLIQTKGEDEEENQDDNPMEQQGEAQPLIIPTGNIIGGDSKPKKESKSIKEKNKKLYEAITGDNDLLNNSYFEARKQSGIIDGRLGNRFYFNNSGRIAKDYRFSTLGLLKEEHQLHNVKRLEEKIKNEKK